MRLQRAIRKKPPQIFQPNKCVAITRSGQPSFRRPNNRGERQRTEQALTHAVGSRAIQKSAGAFYAAILGPGSPPIQQQIRPFADRQ